MEEIKQLLIKIRTKFKQSSLLFLDGFIQACCLHRVFVLCRRSRKLLIRTGQCFLLNGFIFLGSIFVLNSVVIPTLQWILPDRCSQISSQEPCVYGSILKFYYFLRVGLMQLLYIFWFYPLYIFSFILSTLWYNDIAKHGFAAMNKDETNIGQPAAKQEVRTEETAPPKEKTAGLGGVMIGIAEQVYSVLLLSFFFLEVYVTGFIPYIGKVLNFILLSWMYAYYCFEYKWNLSGVPLDKRLDFFESNWAFFTGFGSPCVLAVFFFSPLVSYGVMAILYPLFVLTATASRGDQPIASSKKCKSAGPGRLPIFYAANKLSHNIDAEFERKSEKKFSGLHVPSSGCSVATNIFGPQKYLLMRVLSLFSLESGDQMQESKTK